MTSLKFLHNKYNLLLTCLNTKKLVPTVFRNIKKTLHLKNYQKSFHCFNLILLKHGFNYTEDIYTSSNFLLIKWKTINSRFFMQNENFYLIINNHIYRKKNYNQLFFINKNFKNKISHQISTNKPFILMYSKNKSLDYHSKEKQLFFFLRNFARVISL